MKFLLGLLAFGGLVGAAPSDVTSTLQNILANTHQSEGYKYPTDLTRGIIPVSSLDVLVCRKEYC